METAVSQDRWSEAKQSCADALGTLSRLWDERWERVTVPGSCGRASAGEGTAGLCCDSAGTATSSASPPAAPHLQTAPSRTHQLGVPCAGPATGLGAVFVGVSMGWEAVGGARAAGAQLGCRGGVLPGCANDTLGQGSSQPLYFTPAVWRARPLHCEGPNPTFCLYAHRKAKATAFAG